LINDSPLQKQLQQDQAPQNLIENLRSLKIVSQICIQYLKQRQNPLKIPWRKRFYLRKLKKNQSFLQNRM